MPRQAPYSKGVWAVNYTEGSPPDGVVCEKAAHVSRRPVKDNIVIKIAQGTKQATKLKQAFYQDHLDGNLQDVAPNPFGIYETYVNSGSGTYDIGYAVMILQLNHSQALRMRRGFTQRVLFTGISTEAIILSKQVISLGFSNSPTPCFAIPVQAWFNAAVCTQLRALICGACGQI
ncbi:hypothetical protein D9758_009201 [Tetrapyrgos nigripes]|uniref:Uncharacterized protein n=1 Tax=Tetrapyrgos nigripes TaxID=182062 RepID=A0A8H5D3S8_9AGAR|nr:hypothetical protein D9758_009201 [Tetrapyrgos nigripes]